MEGGGGLVGNVRAGARPRSELDDLKAQKEKTQLEKDILTNQQAIAESQQKIAEANKAALAAQFPAGQAKPVEGTITADTGFGYVSELLAYNAFSKEIESLAKKIDELPIKVANLLIVDSMDFAGNDVDLLQIRSQFEYFIGKFEEENKKNNDLIKPEGEKEPKKWGPGALALGSIPVVASGIVSALADLAGFFQSNYEIKSRAITPQNIALQAMLAGRIKKHRVYFPNFHRLGESDVVRNLKECLKKRTELSLSTTALKSSKKIAQYVSDRKKLEEEIAGWEAELKALKPDDKEIKEKTDALNAKIEKNKEALAALALTPEEQQVARCEQLLAIFDVFQTALLTVPTGKSLSPLAVAAMHEFFEKVKITHLLYLSTISAGGEATLRKGYFRSGRISYLGGGVVACVLADIKGPVVFASTEVVVSNLAYNLDQKEPLKL